MNIDIASLVRIFKKMLIIVKKLHAEISFVRELYSLLCIREISKEKGRGGAILAGACHILHPILILYKPISKYWQINK